MRSKIDHSVFIQCLVKEKEEAIIAVTTDDMAATGNTYLAVERFKNEIKAVYDITDLGGLSWFLGMEIKCNHLACTISINQRVYIKGMAAKYGLDNAKLVHIPMLPGEILTCDQSPVTAAQLAEISDVPYGNMIGHILWPVLIS